MSLFPSKYDASINNFYFSIIFLNVLVDTPMQGELNSCCHHHPPSGEDVVWDSEKQRSVHDRVERGFQLVLNSYQLGSLFLLGLYK